MTADEKREAALMKKATALRKSRRVREWMTHMLAKLASTKTVADGDEPYLGRAVIDRSATTVGIVTSVGSGYCGLEGCTGRRMYVTWMDGKRTQPCTKGCLYDETAKTWRIL